MKIDKWYHLYGTKDEVVFEEVPKPESERKKGIWAYHPEIGWGETWICSECGEKTVSTVMGNPRYKWCPMCGSDMRGEQE